MALMLCPAGAVWATDSPPTAEETVRELASTVMERDRLPSLSIAVGRGGTVVFAEAYGSADLENTVPATPDTVYRIGSATKPLTATLAMALAEEGKLDLDVPVQKYCPAFPPKEAPVTARLLLGHLAGIRDYDYRRFDEEYLSSKRYDSPAEALSIFKDDPLVAAPGAKYQYSSFGYVLLGCALEGAAGIPYEEVLRKKVLDPARMSRTTPDYFEKIVPHRAKGYGMADDGSWKNAVFTDLSDRFPAGGMLSTPRDLVAFGNALLEGKLVPPGTLEEMWQGRHTAGGEATSYGLGWRVSDDGKVAYHGGTSVGSSAYLYIRRDRGIVVAFATNLQLWTEARDGLAQELAETFAR